MAKRKNSTIFGRTKHFFVMVLVTAIFALPIYTTGSWIVGATLGNDPRSTYREVDALRVRPADQVTTAIKPFHEPLLSITFDDGWESSYSVGLPIMQRYGITTTQYVLAGEFKNPTYLSVDQIKDYQKRGHEVASHTYSHIDLTTASDNQLQREVVDAKQILEQFGTIRDFASPLGAINDRSLDLVRQNYRSHRNVAADPAVLGPEDVNTAENFDRYNIIAYTVRRTTTAEDLTRLANYAISKRAWLVITYHQLHDDGSEYAVDARNFEAQMKALYSLPIRTQKMGQVLDAIEVKQHE